MDHQPTTDEIDQFVERNAFLAELSDGTAVRIRPLAPKDKERITEGWKHLSANTRYLRFLHPKANLSKWELAYLTEIDYVDHFAWGVELIDDPDHLGIGIARYIRDTTDPTVAEVAITVVDEYQRLGLGRLLLQAIVEAARENGIERFRAEVSASNEQVIASLTRLGASSTRVEYSGISLEMDLPTEAFHTSTIYEALRAVGSHQASINEDSTTPSV
jgi:RimJ/RimL family protein N-acetyltransferase